MTKDLRSESDSGGSAKVLVIDGGRRAFVQHCGQQEPKIGVDVFLPVAQRFGSAPEALRRLRSAVTNADLPVGEPNLGKYLTASLPRREPAWGQWHANIVAHPTALGVSSGTVALRGATNTGRASRRLFRMPTPCAKLSRLSDYKEIADGFHI